MHNVEIIIGENESGLYASRLDTTVDGKNCTDIAVEEGETFAMLCERLYRDVESRSTKPPSTRLDSGEYIISALVR